MKNLNLPRGPKREWLGPVRRNARAHATHGAAQFARRRPATGRTRARRSSCENTLDQPGNRAITKSTIPPVCYLTTMPIPLSIFTMAIPLAPRARTSAAALAPGGYAGQTSPSPPYLRSQYLPRSEREALDEGSASWDAAVRPDHGGGAPALKTVTFR